MVQAAGDGGRSRTADLEAQRKAQEAARKRAEEAARKAAEEARRKAEAEAKRKAEEQRRQQEAARLAEKRETPNATHRQEGYKSAKTQPLSEETARLQGVFEKYGGAAKPAEPASKTPSLDAAKAKAQELKGSHDDRMKEAKSKYSDASGETRDKVDAVQSKAQDETRKVLDTATQEADKLVKQAETLAADKSPEDKATIMAEADRRATSILESATKSSESLLKQAGDVGEEALKSSHEYENKNWFMKRASDVGNALSTVWDKATDLFDKTVDAVADVTNYAAEQVGNFADWVGDQAFKVVDGALDKSPLGEDAEYTQEKTGMLGELVTNRLEVGESAFIKLDADANIGGVQLGAGAELEIKRVPAKDESGNPRLEPKDEHGEPPTEFEVKLLVDARAGVGLQAEFGIGASTDKGPKSLYGNDINAGAQAGASASAEAGVHAQAEFTFNFDPSSQKDMDDLTGIVGSTAKAALPGIGVLAASDAAKAASNFGSHLTAVRGEVGVYATAQASANVNLGQIDSGSLGKGSEVRVTGTDGKDGQLHASGNRVIEEKTPEDKEEKDYGLKGTAAGMALDKANLNIGELTAGINGEVNVGAQHNFRSGETTVYLNVKGNAQAQASTLGDLSAGSSSEANRTIAIRIKNGEVQGVDVTEEMSSAKFKGIGDQDVRGRLQDDFMVQVEEADSVRVTRSYTSDALADLKSASRENPSKALGNLAQSLMRPDPNSKLEVTDIKATKSNEFSFGFNLAGTGLQVGVGRRLESDLDTVETPSNRNAKAREAVGAR
ncbi:hypothetical protein D3C87_744160 [compost metagenome]